MKRVERRQQTCEATQWRYSARSGVRSGQITNPKRPALALQAARLAGFDDILATILQQV